jgi:ABC-type lipoprotein release transport system permease subunit
VLKLFFWLRYLHKKKIVLLSIAAVAVSCGLLIVVSSLFSGFIDAFERSAVETLGEVVVEPPEKFAKYPEFIAELLKTNQVEAASASLSAEGLLHLGKGNVRAVRVLGIKPGKRSRVLRFKQTMLRQKDVPGDPCFETSEAGEKIGGFIGIAVLAEPDERTDEYDFELAEKMIGQQVILTTGAVVEQKDTSAKQARFKRRTLPFKITDIIFSGIYLYDKNFVYVPIEQLQKKLYPDESTALADRLQIKLSDGADVDLAMARVRDAWKLFAAEQLGWEDYLINQTTIVSAKQMQSRQVAEFRKQMGLLLFIFGVVSLSAVLLIFCIFYMIVMTRQKDIAIMKSSGAANNEVAMIFVGFGGCVGVAGAVVGAIIGYIVTVNINTVEEWIRILFGLKLWKSSVYLFNEIPNQVDWSMAGPIMLIAVAAATIGGLVPAIIAARTKPIDILRYE